MFQTVVPVQRPRRERPDADKLDDVQTPIVAHQTHPERVGVGERALTRYGAGERNRTSNLRFTKPLLCRLSYASLVASEEGHALLDWNFVGLTLSTLSRLCQAKACRSVDAIQR